MTVVIRSAGRDDLPGIVEIYNDAIRLSTAIWNDDPVGLDDRAAWLETRYRQGYPVLVAADAGAIVGYGSFGDFRPFHGYRYTVEHSLYVGEPWRRRGIASALLTGLIEHAEVMGKHVMVAGIDSDNEGSLRLHRKFGFVETARMPEVGIKFGRWLDLVLMQRQLSGGPPSELGAATIARP